MCHTLRQHLQDPVVLLNLDEFKLLGQVSEGRNFTLLRVEDQISQRELKLPRDDSVFYDIAIKLINFFGLNGLLYQLEKCNLSFDFYVTECLINQIVSGGYVELR